jgi:hypothetical protein
LKFEKIIWLGNKMSLLFERRNNEFKKSAKERYKNT